MVSTSNALSICSRVQAWYAAASGRNLTYGLDHCNVAMVHLTWVRQESVVVNIHLSRVRQGRNVVKVRLTWVDKGAMWSRYT